MRIHRIFIGLSIYLLMTINSFSQELIIGEERIDPGIILIFEGAIKDMVMPESCLLYTSPSPRDS